MKRIIAVCGSGLGSSFMIELNIKQIIKELGKDYEVSHASVADVARGDDIIYVCGLDLEETVSRLGTTIVLNNILDVEELKQKLIETIGG